MIQFNLLPDVKVQYIKTQRTKRAVIVISLGIIAFSVGLLIILFSFQTVQKQHLANLDKDIKRLRTELENTPNLTRILSIQNQLNSLPQLYAGRPAVKRLPAYLDQTTPTNIELSELNLDLTLNTLDLSGKAPSLEAVNAYVDTLKYTTFTAGDQPLAQAFTSVVLTSFSRGEDGASYELKAVFNPVIFDGNTTVALNVPAIVTTRAQEPGKALFTGTTEEEEEQ